METFDCQQEIHHSDEISLICAGKDLQKLFAGCSYKKLTYYRLQENGIYKAEQKIKVDEIINKLEYNNKNGFLIVGIDLGEIEIYKFQNDQFS